MVILFSYSQASFPSKLDKQMAKAWSGQRGYRKSIVNMFGATRPNWSTRWSAEEETRNQGLVKQHAAARLPLTKLGNYISQ